MTRGSYTPRGGGGYRGGRGRGWRGGSGYWKEGGGRGGYGTRGDRFSSARAEVEGYRKFNRQASGSGGRRSRDDGGSMEYGEYGFSHSYDKRYEDRRSGGYREDRRAFSGERGGSYSQRDEMSHRRDSQRGSYQPGGRSRGRGIRGSGESRGYMSRRSESYGRPKPSDLRPTGGRYGRRRFVGSQDFARRERLQQRLRRERRNEELVDDDFADLDDNEIISDEDLDEEWDEEVEDEEDEDVEDEEKEKKDKDEKKKPVAKKVKKVEKKKDEEMEVDGEEGEADEKEVKENGDVETAEKKEGKGSEEKDGKEGDDEKSEKAEGEKEETEENAEKEEASDKDKKDDKSGKTDKKDKTEKGKSGSGVQVTIQQDKEGRSVNERRYTPRLQCPYCLFATTLSFKKYEMHLSGLRHTVGMRRVSKQRMESLARMRAKQRQQQRDEEDREELNGTLASHSNFCPICKLNYRQPVGKHRASQMHKEIKDFLMPSCHVCRITFKSPMLYAGHVASLDHIRRKMRLDEKLNKIRERKVYGYHDDDGSDEEEKEVNLDNFMTVDSVGDVDDDEEETDEAKKDKEKDKDDKEVEKDEKEKEKEKESESEEKASKQKERNVGMEYVRKVEGLWCDLCHCYLNRTDPIERSLPRHCRRRLHIENLIRRCKLRRTKRLASSKDETPAKKAKRDEDAAKEGESGETKASAEGGEKKEASGKTGEKSGGVDNEKVAAEKDDGADLGGLDEKLWADVDKDLGDLLKDVEPGVAGEGELGGEVGSDEEDDDSHAGEGGRYDRFRSREEKEAEDAAEKSVK